MAQADDSLRPLSTEPLAPGAVIPDWVAPALIGSALLLQTLNANIIAIALPPMGHSLGVSPVRLNLAITLFMLANAVFMPLSGWVADRYGAKKVFMAAMIIFALSSAACGLAQNLPQLLAARIFQGMTGAMMTPVARTVLLRTTAKSELVGAMAILSMAGTLGPMLGPLVGGAIISFASWRWVFFINLIVAVPCVFLIRRFVPEVKEQETSPLDMFGLVVTGVGLAAMVFGFDNLGHRTLPWPAVAALFVTCFACFALYGRHARNNAHAVLDLSLFRLPTFTAAIVGGFTVRMAVGALPFMLVMLLQVAMGMPAWYAGIMTFAGGAGNLLMRTMSPPILRRFGFRTVLIGNGLLLAATFVVTGLMRTATPAAMLVVVLAAGGFFRALQMSSLMGLTFADVDPIRASRGASLLGVVQQASQSIGVALAAILLQAGLALSGEKHLTPDIVGWTFMIIGALTLTSMIFFVRMPHDAGAEMTAGKAKPAKA